MKVLITPISLKSTEPINSPQCGNEVCNSACGGQRNCDCYLKNCGCDVDCVCPIV